jgi:diaminopimelate decarboxylase
MDSRYALPLSREQIEKEIRKGRLSTPCHLYSQAVIEANVRALHGPLEWGNHINYFALKATPTPKAAQVVLNAGCGLDVSSEHELRMARRLGAYGNNIMMTSNNTPMELFERGLKSGAIINFDDRVHVAKFRKRFGKFPRIGCCRYNPGPRKKGSNKILSDPTDQKYGMPDEQLEQAYRDLHNGGCTEFGIHTMVASNELDPEYFVETAHILFEKVVELSKKLGIRFVFVNIGGGIGIPYRPEQKPVNLERVGKGIRKAYEAIILGNGLGEIRIFTEMGRMITGPAGWLITRIRHVTHKYNTYVGCDTGSQDLLRATIYPDAYHHVIVLGKEGQAPSDTLYNFTGATCENSDQLAKNRELPLIEEGDLVAFCYTGAHGRAMGNNYNGQLRCAEYLLLGDGNIIMIRRPETFEDLDATLIY